MSWIEAGVRALIEEQEPGAAGLRLEVRPLRGGLESPAVLHVVARYADRRGRPRVRKLVVKALEPGGRREELVYRRLAATGASLAPRLLHAHDLPDQRRAIYLDAVRAARRWPWRELDVAARVLEEAAAWHRTACPLTRAALASWDYEALLQRSAEETLDLFAVQAHDLQFAPDVRTVRRAARELPRLRRALAENPDAPAAPLHGDLHPGNVVVAKRGAGLTPLLLDWAWARLGSPLEDVASWIESLAFWEPEAFRRHDTLLLRYVRARGGARLDAALRDAYWAAAASNTLAGALRYHVHVAATARDGPTRAASWRAARNHLRILRRALAASR